MKISRYILYCLTLGSLTLASCSGDDGLSTDNTRKDIKLTVGWGETRASISEANRNKMYVGEDVHSWGYMHNPADNSLSTYFKAWLLRPNMNGELAAADAVKQFPAANRLDIYTMKGFFTGISIVEDVTEMPENIAFRVEDSQTAESGYYHSDLLFSVMKQVPPTESAIAIPFYHMLSQVRILLKAGAEVTNDQLAGCSVQIINPKYSGVFTPNTSDDADMSDPATRAAMISVNSATSQAILVKAGEQSAFLNDNDMVSAILPPQTYAAGSPMIKITLANSDEFIFKPSADVVLESGKAYKFVITVNDGKAQGIVTTLAGWVDSVDDNGINFERTL